MNRVRLIYLENGNVFSGSKAIGRIHWQMGRTGLATPQPGKRPFYKWEYAQAALNTMITDGFTAGKLTIYREPRHIRAKNSRYRQALRGLQILNGQDRPQVGRTPIIIGRNKRNPPRSRAVRMLEQDLIAATEINF